MSMDSKNRNFKYGSFSIVITILVILAVLALNVLMTYLENEYGLRADFTPETDYTLDSSSLTAINGLENDVVIYSFIPKGESSTYSDMTEKIVALFDGASKRITSENIDPILNPARLKQFSTDTKPLASYAVVVAEKDNESNFYAFNEKDDMISLNERTLNYYFILQNRITAALISMRTGVRTNVYVLTGHGEDVDGAKIMFDRIGLEGYSVQTISLISGAQTLRQGDVLIMLEPESDLLKEEYDALINFLDDNHGKMLVMFSRLSDEKGNKLTNYANLFDYFNISLLDGVLAETDPANCENNSVKKFRLTTDASHEITAKLGGSKVYPLWVGGSSAFAFRYEGNRNNTALYSETFTPLLTTYPTAVLVPWGTGEDVSGGTKGRYTVAAAYEKLDKSKSTDTVITSATRIFLAAGEDIGVSDYLGNVSVLRNGINWLAGKNEGDTLPSLGIDLSGRYMQLTRQQMNVWYVVLVVAVPLLLLVAGVVVWLRRKNL